MKTYVYKGFGGQYGITINPDGSNLPVDLGPWTRVKTIDVEENDHPRIGMDLSGMELHQTLLKEGYVLQLATIEFEEKIGIVSASQKGADG